MLSLKPHISRLTEPWQPLEIARFDNYAVRLALFHGTYHRHVHENGDELFCVYRGLIEIQMRGRDTVIVKERECACVPKGVVHCPRSSEQSYVLMFERYDLESKDVD